MCDKYPFLFAKKFLKKTWLCVCMVFSAAHADTAYQYKKKISDINISTNDFQHSPSVIQLGFPHDNYFAFCGGQACPLPSIKHLYEEIVEVQKAVALPVPTLTADTSGSQASASVWEKQDTQRSEMKGSKTKIVSQSPSLQNIALQNRIKKKHTSNKSRSKKNGCNQT